MKLAVRMPSRLALIGFITVMALVVPGLRVEAQHFLECVIHGRQPLTDGHCGLRMVRILEAAAKSLADRGQPVALASAGEGPAASRPKLKLLLERSA